MAFKRGKKISRKHNRKSYKHGERKRSLNSRVSVSRGGFRL